MRVCGENIQMDQPLPLEQNCLDKGTRESQQEDGVKARCSPKGSFSTYKWIAEDFPTRVHTSSFGDDLATWTSQEYISTANNRWQQVLSMSEECQKHG